MLGGEIARMAAKCLGTLAQEVLAPLLDLAGSEPVLAGNLSGSRSALDEFENNGGFALGSPALQVVRRRNWRAHSSLLFPSELRPRKPWDVCLFAVQSLRGTLQL